MINFAIPQLCGSAVKPNEKQGVSFGSARNQWRKYNHKYFFGDHTAQRLNERHSSKDEVVKAINEGEIKESKKPKSRKTPVFVAYFNNLLVFFTKGKKVEEEYYVRTTYRDNKDTFLKKTKD